MSATVEKDVRNLYVWLAGVDVAFTPLVMANITAFTRTRSNGWELHAWVGEPKIFSAGQVDLAGENLMFVISEHRTWDRNTGMFLGLLARGWPITIENGVQVWRRPQ
ncbi:MAG: hypothetical protein JWN89_678 [Parcubacteria group bacterium]|nr:hypothetical protein [Parcubacteria group bacterium]